MDCLMRECVTEVTVTSIFCNVHCIVKIMFDYVISAAMTMIVIMISMRMAKKEKCSDEYVYNFINHVLTMHNCRRT